MLKASAESVKNSGSAIFGLFSFQSLMDHLKNNPIVVDLSHCDMKYCTTIQWQQLGDGLRRCVALNELALSSNLIFSASRDKYQAACQAIAQAQKLKKLDLSHNFTTIQNHEMWAAIGRMITSFPDIEELSLRGCLIGKIDRLTPDYNKLFKEICITVGIQSSLSSIDLRFNSLVNLSDSNLNLLFSTILSNQNIHSVTIIDEENQPNSNKISLFNVKQKEALAAFTIQLSCRQRQGKLLSGPKLLDKKASDLAEEERVVFEQLKQQVKKSTEQTKLLQEALTKLQENQLIPLQAPQAKRKFTIILENFPNALLFYKMVNIKLEEIFIGIKAVASSLLPTNLHGKLHSAGNIVNIVGTILSFLPLAGNALNKASEIVQTQLNTIDTDRSLSLAREISGIGTFEEITILSERIAREITICYLAQLNDLKSASEIDSQANSASMGTHFEYFSEQVREYGKHSYQYIAGVRCKEPAYALAEYCVMRILSSLLSEKINTKLSLLPQILSELNEQNDLKQSLIPTAQKIISNPLKEILKLLFDDKTLLTRSGKTWVLGGIFCKPGLQTQSGLYTSSDLDHSTYGFRWCFEDISNRTNLRALSVNSSFSPSLIANFHKDIQQQGLDSDIQLQFKNN